MNLARNTAILWRGPGAVQVGGDSSRHVLLDNLHANDQLWLSHQAHSPRSAEPIRASPELMAALHRAHLIDEGDRRPTARVGVHGAVPASILALRSLVDTINLSLAIDVTALVDEDWDRVFGGTFTGTARDRAIRRELAPLIPLPHLHHQGDTDCVIVSADRVVDPGVPFELTVHDTAHLIVTRGEHSYQVGPFVIPGITPCYQCVEHARATADPFRLTHLRELADWPLGTLPLLAHYAAALRVARLVRDFVSGALTASLCAEVATIDEDGTISVERARPAHECVCGICGLAS
ncbi:hypothetical protein [Actinomyces sp.]